VILIEPNANRAVVVGAGGPCYNPDTVPRHSLIENCSDVRTRAYYLVGSRWLPTPPTSLPSEQSTARDARVQAALRNGAVEVREITRRRVFVNGEPVGDAFE
jgi:hypothetical protein